MRSKLKANTGYGQFRWVVLLLLVVVILPTVCLLWFMNEAIDNERLVIRQKLVTVCKSRLDATIRKVDQDWVARCRRLGQDDAVHAYREFVAAAGQNGCDGLLIYAPSGEPLYPALTHDAGGAGESPEMFADAWQLEFVDRDYAQAAQCYEKHARSALTDPRRLANLLKKGLAWPSQDPQADLAYDRRYLAALIGQSRSLGKLDRIDEAVETCQPAVFTPLAETGDASILSLIANAQLLMLSWVRDRAQYEYLLEVTFTRLMTVLYQPNQAGASLTTDQNLFVAQKAFDLIRATPRLEAQWRSIHKTSLSKLIAAEERSIELLSRFPDTAAFQTWLSDKLQPLTDEEPTAYGLVHRSQQRTYFALISEETIRSVLAEFAGMFQNEYLDCRILDEAGRPVMGIAEPEKEPFTTGAIGTYFPNWKIELFFKEGDELDRAAGQRIAMYTWTGTLVIMVILAFGAVAAKAIGRQVKLNRLKNDFIATVTHELKTPLASMRVLVDTLLEGHYRDQQQVTEYLELISRENGRLSRLIDNFLTFSRMERNKQAFRIRAARPEAIAQAATEAVKTKFDRAACHLDVEIDDDLPEVRADVDAMITVLVNLLDNACKYSYDDKRIALRVTSENHSVCFAVSDNGVGIPRRAVKRIFKRFYQTDRSLARRAEGCGLGLSIAKFIIDAHGGTIGVESKPGQGSVFTVRLPVHGNI
ncbi:MAG: HAMP domain-containing histidine kinase [Phycisphaerales bacterium]|nr:MAG: HAMP domain-containing histidine kinase [Phycisphaerales bacterium]